MLIFTFILWVGFHLPDAVSGVLWSNRKWSYSIIVSIDKIFSLLIGVLVYNYIPDNLI